MNKKQVLLTQLSAAQLLAIPKSEWRSLVQATAVEAVNYSIVHGDTTKATSLLGVISSVIRHPNSKRCLTSYLEKWGNLQYVSQNDCFTHARKLRPDEWTEAYKVKVSEYPWDSEIETSRTQKKTVIDAELEIRKLIDRLEKITREPGGQVVNSTLIRRVRELLCDFSSSSAELEKGKQVQTLFDTSTANSTLRAGKYAKGS